MSSYNVTSPLSTCLPPLGALEVPFSKAGDIRQRVHLMPNPCMFRVNEGTPRYAIHPINALYQCTITTHSIPANDNNTDNDDNDAAVLFGVTSNDVLFALSSDEVSCSSGPGFHRIARLAAHVLQQRSFAPQFPPANNSIAQVSS